VLSAAAFALAVTQVGPASASGQPPARRTAILDPHVGRGPVVQTASAVLGGAISGTVSDERGGPLSGAMVSVQGATIAMTVSDALGRFSLARLPAGEYVLRAHLSGFAASRREIVRVGASVPASLRLQLQRLETTVGTSGRSEQPTARPIIAAGFGLPQVASPEGKPGEDHSHSETAWRLRHLSRSILKDSANAVVFADDATPPEGSLFGRAVGSAASVAASLFTDLPFSGEVNLLTTSALGAGERLPRAVLPRGVANLSIGAPTSAGDWSLRAAMSEGDLSSWILAGAFVSRPASAHAYNLGLTYSTQEYQGGNPLALAAVTDGSRNVGEVYALDRWSLSPGVTVEYGARYARYDYLGERGLLSPRAGFTLEPVKGTRVTAILAQRMVAPGAEEFLAPANAGPWLPPERTFSPFDGNALRVERARSLDVLVEHEFEQTYVLGIRRFFQSTDNQLVTVFGLDGPGGTPSVGHYYVASAGAVDAQGWGLRVSSRPSRRVRASLDYSLTRGRWNSRGDAARLNALAPSAIRPKLEDSHDITTSFQADIPETATRVFLLYKLNTAYSRSNADLTQPGLDARFDVQINQALPFGVGGMKWEVLVGVRNLFRDPADPASVYDELLVVRPPKRVVGGFLVRF